MTSLAVNVWFLGVFLARLGLNTRYSSCSFSDGMQNFSSISKALSKFKVSPEVKITYHFQGCRISTSSDRKFAILYFKYSFNTLSCISLPHLNSPSSLLVTDGCHKKLLLAIIYCKEQVHAPVIL